MAELKNQLAPISAEERPVPPSVPGLRDPSAAATAERVCLAENRAGPLPHLTGRAESLDPWARSGPTCLAWSSGKAWS